MQSVNAAFTAEERDTVRKVIQNTQISWKRQSTLSNRTFTIGVSTIGGNDVIGINPGAIGSPSNYKYFDESSYIEGLSWERGLNLPIGGLTKALAEVRIDNTSGRFTPRYMGGSSELYTAILPRRPLIISAGFNFSGIDQSLPQFAGIVTEQPEVDMRSRSVRIRAADYLDYFSGKYIDKSAMYTSKRTDELIEPLFVQLGMSTAQYNLDQGINIIPFAKFEAGDSLSETLNHLVQAEYGHLYQDEVGVFRFENRQHWDASPYNSVQRIIYTSQVLNAEAPNEDHIINVVEVKAQQRAKQPEQIIFRLNPFDSITLAASASAEILINFDDPVLSLTTPSGTGTVSFFKAYSNADSTGTDLTGSVTITKVTLFAQAAKLEIYNSSTSIAYITNLVITGRSAPVEREIYTRASDSSSITAYQERKYVIDDNPFIQNQDWAETLSQMIVNDFADPENLQVITIKAIPSLQIGDLISWQGRYWRIFHSRTNLSPMGGFVQELTLLQRTITSYFRIGISTIGGRDKIAP